MRKTVESTEIEALLQSLPRSDEAERVLSCRSIETPLGPMFAAASDDSLFLLEFMDRRMLKTQLTTLHRRLAARFVWGSNGVLANTESELGEYFAGSRRSFTLALELPGTAFQQAVWQQLIRIPYGTTTSYSAIAASVGSPDAVRAVGKANGDNRIAVIVPCHRVVQSDGALCGYGGGLWRKRKLLELESGQGSLLN